MNIITVYIVFIVVILINLAISNIYNSQSLGYLQKFSTESNKNIACGGDFAKFILFQNNIDSVDVAEINVKHTNYYTSKFKAIKLSSKKYNSNSLTNICYCSNLSNNAIKDLKSPLLFKFNIVLNFLSNLINLIFIPALLIFAILSTGFGLKEISFYVLISILSLEILLFIYKLITCQIQIKQQKNILNIIEKSNMFDKSEMNTIENIFYLQRKQDFAEYGYKMIAFLKLISPTTIFDRNKKDS